MLMQAPPFRFALAQRLALMCSGEAGEVIARSESTLAEPSYLLRYRGADGRAVEVWWAQSALEPTDGRPPTLIDGAAVAQSDLPPAIGQVWASQGGIYAGVARGADGAPDHHLILCAAKPDSTLAWDAAVEWADHLQAEGKSDWHLPTRDESALLYAHLRDEFEPAWHWTGTQYSRNLAWYQNFGVGYQDYRGKVNEGRARAVRRLIIHPFGHS